MKTKRKRSTRRRRRRRRVDARGDRDSGPAREAGLHDPERLSPEGVRAGGRRRRAKRERRSRSSIATFASSRTGSCIRSTTSCAHRARRSTSRSVRRRPTSREGCVLTGGRVKIGYQAGIKLLRAGAHLIVTTRFPRDSAARYPREADFADWGDRLQIYGLDLRHTPSVEAFCRHLLATHDRLDYIVNNACQTVRRPPDFYRHMLGAELAASTARSHPRQSGSSGATRVCGATTCCAMEPRASRRRGLVASESPSSAAELSQVRLLPEEARRTRATSFPRGGSIRICSRSTSATAIRGASCSPRCRRSSCSRRSSSTPSRRSSSTRA